MQIKFFAENDGVQISRNSVVEYMVPRCDISCVDLEIQMENKFSCAVCKIMFVAFSKPKH